MLDEKKYTSIFESFEKSEPKTSPWINALRRQAIGKFIETGFPTLRDEEWKYTNVAPLVREPFQFSFERHQNGLTPQKIQSLLIGEKQGPVLVFVNGIFSPELSKVGALPQMSLAEALRKHPEPVQSYLSKIVPYDQNGFAALNTAFVRDGAFLWIKEDLKVPIQLVFISAPSRDHVLFQPRNLMVLEEGGRAQVIETHLYGGPSVRSYCQNSVTEIILKKNSSLDHYKVQREEETKGAHIATTRVLQEEGSRFHSFSLSLGAKLARENLGVSLEGARAECILNGLYLVSKGRHVDHHTRMDHAKPGAKSRQFYKGVIHGKSTAVFSGKVYVHKDASKSDAEQTNKNLLLSEDATVDTKPQLEIYNDDVKCTHGAAVGQLDQEEIFYLQSRGVNEKEARNILTHGFVAELVQAIEPEPLRRTFDQFVGEWLDENIKE